MSLTVVWSPAAWSRRAAADGGRAGVVVVGAASSGANVPDGDRLRARDGEGADWLGERWRAGMADDGAGAAVRAGVAAAAAVCDARADGALVVA